MKNKHSEKEKHSVIIKHNDKHESMSDYDLHVTKDVRGGLNHSWDQRIKMKYGQNSDWAQHIKGTTAAKLKDNGDDITITLGNQKITLDYSEIEQLQALLMYHNDVSNLNDSPATFTFYTANKIRNNK